jgi:hypothetical protein
MQLCFLRGRQLFAIWVIGNKPAFHLEKHDPDEKNQ